jgi:hypothetical protein
MRRFSIEFESRGQAVTIFTQARQRLFAAAVASNFEAARSGDSSEKSYRQTVTPLRDLHSSVPWIYK